MVKLNEITKEIKEKFKNKNPKRDLEIQGGIDSKIVIDGSEVHLWITYEILGETARESFGPYSSNDKAYNEGLKDVQEYLQNQLENLKIEFDKNEFSISER